MPLCHSFYTCTFIFFIYLKRNLLNGETAKSQRRYETYAYWLIVRSLFLLKNLLHMLEFLSSEAASSPRTDESKKFNKKQLILRNLHPDTTEGEVRVFIIQLADKSPSTIKFHHDNTAAMAGFQENIGKLNHLWYSINRLPIYFQLPVRTNKFLFFAPGLILKFILKLLLLTSKYLNC